MARPAAAGHSLGCATNARRLLAPGGISPIMARLVVEGDDIAVKLTALERFGALRGNFRVPRSAVREVRASDRPWSELRGIRAPGTGLPAVIALVTRRGGGGRDFTAVYPTRSPVLPAPPAPP